MQLGAVDLVPVGASFLGDPQSYIQYMVYFVGILMPIQADDHQFGDLRVP